MGTYGLDGVIQAWELEKLTAEQAIGQLLQIIGDLDQRLEDVERNHRRLTRLLTSASLQGWPREQQVLEKEI